MPGAGFRQIRGWVLLMSDVSSKAELRAIEAYRSRCMEERGRFVSLEEAESEWLALYAVQWREQRQREMLKRQREEILRHKWIESEKAHRDLGAEAALDWIKRYAADWRRWYEAESEKEQERDGQWEGPPNQNGA